MEMTTVCFNRFSLEIPSNAIWECSCPGDATESVSWYHRFVPEWPDRTDIELELREYGCWDDLATASDTELEHRLLWVAAGNAADEEDSNVER